MNDKFNASEWIAIILALTVAYVFVTKMVFAFIYPQSNSAENNLIWLDILKFLTGGLIGYISRGSDK